MSDLKKIKNKTIKIHRKETLKKNSALRVAPDVGRCLVGTH